MSKGQFTVADAEYVACGFRERLAKHRQDIRELLSEARWELEHMDKAHQHWTLEQRTAWRRQLEGSIPSYVAMLEYHERVEVFVLGDTTIEIQPPLDELAELCEGMRGEP